MYLICVFICILKLLIMKTKILLLIAILFSLPVLSQAQIAANKVLLGGSVSYYSTSNPDFHSFYSSIQAGKVIKENTVVGLVVGYSSNNNNSSYNSPIKTRSYNAGIFYRKYKKLLPDFYFFWEADGSYTYSNNTQQAYSNGEFLNSKLNGGTVIFIPGISYAISKRIQVELASPNLVNLSYTRTATIDSSLPAGILPQKSNKFSAGVNLNSNNFLANFAVGFKLLLGK